MADIWNPTLGGNACLVALAKVPIQVIYLRPKVGMWGLTQCHGGRSQFWGRNELFQCLLHNTSWSLNGRSDKEFMFRPSFGHKVTMNCVKKKKSFLPSFSPKIAESEFLQILRRGQKIHVPPIFFELFLHDQ